MSEGQALVVAIRFIGLWRIFTEGGNNLYYIAVKQLGLRTASVAPVSMDIQALVFNLLLGTIVIAAAPALVQLIYGARKAGS